MKIEQSNLNDISKVKRNIQYYSEYPEKINTTCNRVVNFIDLVRYYNFRNCIISLSDSATTLALVEDLQIYENSNTEIIKNIRKACKYDKENIFVKTHFKENTFT